MNLLQPLFDSEALNPLDLVDPTLADTLFRKKAVAEDVQAFSFSLRPAPLTVPVRSAGVTELLQAYAAGTLTPPDVLAQLKNAIADDPHGSLAVINPVPDAEVMAQESAERWQSNEARPLEGIFFGVKDIIDVRGAMVTSGSFFTGNRIAPADADVVARLRAAGAIPFAMVATTEFATGSPHNPRYGTVLNPWDSTRWTGGSSSGSGAALAFRLMPFALGTDTGGSIRVPSCWCGTTGFKPGRELVSRTGVAPLSWTLDHVGPMTRNVRDIATVLPFMTATPDATLLKDCAAFGVGAPDISGLRIGIPINWFTDIVSSDVLANWRSALETLRALGCELVDLPHIPVEPLHAAGWTILLSELAAHHSERIDQAHLFDKGLVVRLKQGMEISAAEYGKALRTRKQAQDIFLSAMRGIDLIITPGLGGEAGSLDTLTVDVDGAPHSFQDIISRNTMIFDLIGFPALMLPSGLGKNSLPTGMQMVGRPGAEALCLQAGVAFQTVTSHHLNAPARLEGLL